jgi:hypothetical protein
MIMYILRDLKAETLAEEFTQRFKIEEIQQYNKNSVHKLYYGLISITSLQI